MPRRPPPPKPPRVRPHLPAGALASTTFGVLFIGALLLGSLWVLQPFLGPTLWATMVVVASWPLMRRAEELLWGRRGLAVLVMTIALLLLFVVPLALATVTIVSHADQLVDWGKLAANYHLPAQPPLWLVQLPLVGEWLAQAWDRANDLGLRDLAPRLSPYAGNLTRWFVGQVGNVGFLLLQFLVTVVVAAVLYANGEEAAALIRRFAKRLGGERGEAVVDLAGGAIRGVALGVGATAVAQALLSGLGLALAGVPFAGLATAVIFMLCIAQIGPLPVLLPAIIWALWADHTGWGIFLIVLAAVVTTLDNVLRPVLIRLGADLPLLLIFTGVVGGLLAFGLVGIFVGPLVLAVAWTLLDAWMADTDDAALPAAPAAAAPETERSSPPAQG